MKMVAIIVAVVSVFDVALVCFENIPVITTMNWLPVFVFGKDPSMSVADGPLIITGAVCVVYSLYDGFLCTINSPVLCNIRH